MIREHVIGRVLLGVHLLGVAGAEVENELSVSVVLAERRGAFSGFERAWGSAQIREFGPRSLDEVLMGDPAFSLFRRQNSSFANPTSAGISLGNTGASAASRSLVLRDGIPQNDPFGGWVSWTRYDVGTMDSARIASSAESVVWGNMSSAGSVHLTSSSIENDRMTLRVEVGTQGTVGGAFTLDEVSNNGEFAASVHVFSRRTSGFFSLNESQRGAVDRRLDLRYHGADLRMRWLPREHFLLETMFSFYDEDRGNGTEVSRNGSRAFDFSVRATSESERTSLQCLAYFQKREFSSVFAAVAAGRDSERVALNQYDVPGQGVGGAVVYEYDVDEGLMVSGGVDFRMLEGETNEDAGTFRRRQAGGKQSFIGLFARTNWEVTEDTELDASVRLDHWRFSGGFRDERSLGTGASLRSDRYADRSSVEPSISVSLRHEIDEDLLGWVTAGSSFRAPTINELYRPFRVRSDVTEANAALDPERFFSLEAGVEWRPDEKVNVTASVYHHWIRDAIANVPVTDAGEIAQIFGALPAGGTGAQRQNVDEARVGGIRLSAEYIPDPRVTLRFDGLWSRTEFSASPNQRLIEGEAFAQSPELRLLGLLVVRPVEDWSFFLGAEYVSEAFDDLLGQRELPSYWTWRMGANWQAKESLRLNVRVENLFDEEVTTGLANNGLRSVGQPRAIWFGAEYAF